MKGRCFYQLSVSMQCGGGNGFDGQNSKSPLFPGAGGDLVAND